MVDLVIPEAQGTTEEPWEINAAYGLIKSTLAGSSLYKTSLKNGEIMLSFISPQVGERYGEQITVLSRQTGWPLRINPSPNQGAILESARRLLDEAGCNVTKGPGIHLELGQVAVTLAEAPVTGELAALCAAFQEETGFQLSVQAVRTPPPPTTSAPSPDTVEIPLALIRLRPHQQGLELDPLKFDKAVRRARHLGIKPPIEVRRVRDGYLLIDGLYRLRAAESLGWDRIPAVVQ